MKTWKDIPPSPEMLAALERAAPQPPPGSEASLKIQWSNVFADACAVMLADELRKSRYLSRYAIFPDQHGAGAEFVTAAGARGKGKKVDVSVSTLSAGLQLALTLKGGNFPDPGDGGYGKNLTGRLYELLDETREVHEYHPHTTIVCVYFFPLAATVDRTRRATFARAVATLRASTGRIDPLAPGQFGRFDWSVIGLYTPDDFDGVARGVVRFFDVFEAPPQRGRPRIETTMDMSEFVQRAIDLFREGRVSDIAYTEPEPG